MDQKNYNIALALAGILQASALVRDLARTGQVASEPFAASIQSLFKINARNVADVYAGEENLAYGMTCLKDVFSKENKQKDVDLNRYLISLLYLERRLARSQKTLALIGSRIEQAKTKADYFSPTHPNVIANLAEIYTDTLSKFRFRIQVLGESHYLTPPDNINKVRALLLAGIRSTVLWRQLGGSRWFIIFGRTKILAACEQYRTQHLQSI